MTSAIPTFERKNNQSEHGKSSIDPALFVELLVDAVAKAKVTIDTTHNKIHDGLMFECAIPTLVIPSQASINFLIETNGVGMHLQLITMLINGSPLEFTLTENPTVTSVGTPIPAPINKNRYAADNSPTEIFQNAAITDPGLFLYGHSIDVGKANPADDTGLVTEWILNGTKQYLIQIDNNSNQAIGGSLHVVWYHTSLP